MLLGKPKLEIKQLEQDLIATYDHKEIRELLKKISMNQLATNVWNINPQWDLPIPIQSVIKSLPRGDIHVCYTNFFVTPVCRFLARFQFCYDG